MFNRSLLGFSSYTRITTTEDKMADLVPELILTQLLPVYGIERKRAEYKEFHRDLSIRVSSSSNQLQHNCRRCAPVCHQKFRNVSSRRVDSPPRRKDDSIEPCNGTKSSWFYN